MKQLVFSVFICLSGICRIHAHEVPANFEIHRLVAWCIVPFDASERTPEQRALMLKELGLRRCAYDWRQKHVPEFEREIMAYKRHGIEFFAFWAEHEKAFALFEKHGLRPQIWRTLNSPKQGTQQDKISAATEAMEPLAKRTAELGFPLGLYNHGGWGGEPANLVAVCERLHEKGYVHVGIVYNWHHAHDKIAKWPAILSLIKPYLLCLNINGMNPGGVPKILELGKGSHEMNMIEVINQVGYQGPIGILDHQRERDTREVLKENLDGLRSLIRTKK